MRKNGRDRFDTSYESGMERDEPDWDYSYDPSSAARNRSDSIRSSWDDGSNSIVALPSRQLPFASSRHDKTPAHRSMRDPLSRQAPFPSTKEQNTTTRDSERASLSRQSSLPSITEQKTTTRKLTSLEILCANHQCAVQQEPQQTYYQTVVTEKPTPKPKPPRPAVQAAASSITSEQRRRDDNHIRRTIELLALHDAERRRRDDNRSRRTMEQNLVDSAIKKNSLSEFTFEPQEEKQPPLACSMPFLFNTTSPTPPPPPEAPSVVIAQKRKVKRKSTGAHLRQTNNDKERTSPTSVNDIVEELSDLQDQLDALRMTQPTITREALVDAAAKAKTEELVELPILDEELLDGVPFHAFDAQRVDRESSATRTFADLVNALHKFVPPVLEESFVDEGVHMRHFDSDEEVSRPKSTLTISIAELEASPPRKPKSESEAPVKVDSKARTLSSDRDAPESLQPEKEGPTLWSPLPGFSKKKSKSRSSCSTYTTSDYSTPQKNKSNGFSIRSALASVRRPKTVTVSEEAISTAPTKPRKKSVRFSRKLVTSLHYRPKTLPHELGDLYFSQEELEQLERDREQSIYEEQFETVAGSHDKHVAVTYPVRRVAEKQPPSLSVPIDVREAPAPEMVDSSGSWSSGSEAEGAQVFEI